MKLILILCLTLLACDPSPPSHPNLAVTFWHMVQKVNNQAPTDCVEMSTGWGFIPDSALCTNEGSGGPPSVLKCIGGPTINPDCFILYPHADAQPGQRTVPGVHPQHPPVQ